MVRMGLDTYPSRVRDDISLTPDDEDVLGELELSLCEWGRRGSFRGKVYIDLVQRVTGATLMEEWIPPEEVVRMAEVFEACDPEAVSQACRDDYYPVSTAEVRALRKLLRICANRGLGLVGSI